jgi:CubicO group peptidase (beta-lactamase class C family)
MTKTNNLTIHAVLCLTSALVSSVVYADEPIDYFFSGAKSYKAPHIALISPAKKIKELKKSDQIDNEIKIKLDDILDGVPSGGLAVLAINNGEIVYERYARSNQANLYPSWSMAKSITALTLGYALCDGKIRSLDDLAENYSEELRGTVWGKSKIVDLLTMSSGASQKTLDKTTGDYHPRDPASLHYILKNGQISLKEAFTKYSKLDGANPPGVIFSYNNMDTQAISSVIEGATGVSFPEYFQRTLWENAGAQFESVWYLDKNKQALSSAFFFSSMRDYGRLAQIVVDAHQGKLSNKCLETYIKDATTHKRSAGGNSWYGYQFWLGPLRQNAPIVKMMGHQGQEIFINYKNGKIIVLTAYSAALREKYRDPSNLLPWLLK